jgi:hypothetical protein
MEETTAKASFMLVTGSSLQVPSTSVTQPLCV